MIENFETLKTVRNLTNDIYILANNFPQNEMYGLRSQFTRAFISIRLNLSEGYSYRDNHQRNFYNIAMGSIYETIECINIAIELKYISKESCLEVLNQLDKAKAQLNKILQYDSNNRSTSNVKRQTIQDKNKE